jgi:hypothetical protein
VALYLICLQCQRILEPAASGRPRRYCSAACRQRAYRQRARAAAQDEDGIVALARHLRDNADRLWVLAQGWHPPPEDQGPASLAQLAVDTARLATRLADLDHQLSPEPGERDETDDKTRRPPSPGRGMKPGQTSPDQADRA